MKKILSVILVVVLVLGLCACGASGSKDSGGSFSVGYPHPLCPGYQL